MSEFGPSPAEEAEREATGISLASEIAELRSRARTDEDFQVILQKVSELKGVFRPTSEGKLSGEVSEQMKKAEEIMGADFFGPEQVQSAFLGQIEISEVPSIPFSSEDLEKAKELGQMLILRVEKTKDGSALTMEKISELLEGKLKDDTEVLYGDWYKEEGFYKTETPEMSWALVSKDVVPDSTSKNYLAQTERLVEYLKNEIFKDKEIPPEYAEAIEEFENEKAAIAAIVESSVESEWKEAARRLEALKINQLTRQTPVESLYDSMVYFQQAGERLLPDKYSWTNRRDSDGGLVYVGDFRSDGVDVLRVGSGGLGSSLGVSFSRSQ